MRNKLIPIILLGLTPVMANAADLASKKSGAPEKSSYHHNWTGLYAGAHIGYDWNTANRDTYIYTTGVFNLSSTFKSDGLFGGLQMGYNQQLGRLVIGVEGDVSLADIKGSLTTLIPNETQIGGVSAGKETALASIRGRLGYAFNNVLFYGTGGIAFKAHEGSRTQYATASTVAAAANFSTAPVFVEKSTSSPVGGTIGGGAEYAFDKNWSVNASYNYTKWQNGRTIAPLALTSVYNYVAPGVSNGRDTYSSSSAQSIRMGVNYKF